MIRLGKAATALVALRLAGFAALLAVWTYAATQLQQVQLPSPVLVLQALRDNFIDAQYLHLQAIPGGYWSSTQYTVGNALGAFAIGSTAGFVAGLASARVQLVRDAVTPLLILFGAVPPLVAAPFMLIWFGVGPLGQRALVVFVCFVIVGINSLNAALKLAPHYEEVAATLGVSKLRSFLTVVTPGSLPSIIGAVRVSLATAWSLQVAAELFGSKLGVGRVIALSQAIGFTAGTIAVICILAAVGSVVDFMVNGALRWLVRWQASVAH